MRSQPRSITYHLDETVEKPSGILLVTSILDWNLGTTLDAILDLKAMYPDVPILLLINKTDLLPSLCEARKDYVSSSVVELCKNTVLVTAINISALQGRSVYNAVKILMNTIQ